MAQIKFNPNMAAQNKQKRGGFDSIFFDRKELVANKTYWFRYKPFQQELLSLHGDIISLLVQGYWLNSPYPKDREGEKVKRIFSYGGSELGGVNEIEAFLKSRLDNEPGMYDDAETPSDVVEIFRKHFKGKYHRPLKTDQDRAKELGLEKSEIVRPFHACVDQYLVQAWVLDDIDPDASEQKNGGTVVRPNKARPIAILPLTYSLNEKLVQLVAGAVPGGGHKMYSDQVGIDFFIRKIQTSPTSRVEYELGAAGMDRGLTFLDHEKYHDEDSNVDLFSELKRGQRAEEFISALKVHFGDIEAPEQDEQPVVPAENRVTLEDDE